MPVSIAASDEEIDRFLGGLDAGTILLIHNAGEILAWPENPGAFAVILNQAGISWTLSSEVVAYDSINYGLWYDDAQFAKLDLICRKLRLRPGERFLDVGCGINKLPGALGIDRRHPHPSARTSPRHGRASASAQRRHRGQPALAHQRPIVELLRLLDLGQTHRRVQPSGELEVRLDAVHEAGQRVRREDADVRAQYAPSNVLPPAPRPASAPRRPTR